ncbi:phosphoribosyl-AMP cyclohydrolase, partial [Burkholderia pseudomallei]
VYYSRSRQRLWFMGEESGHVQHVHEVRLDCDEDVGLLKVEQVEGIACHTGRRSCCFQKFEGTVDDGEWVAVDPVLKDREHLYKGR